jgi:hypothetical protein
MSKIGKKMKVPNELTKQRFSENPFLKSLDVKKSPKQVRVSILGATNNVLLNQDTGEIQGTHIVSYKEVDDAEFVKVFTRNIALTFNLSSAGIKAFNILMYAVQYNAIKKDVVKIDERILINFLKQYPEIKGYALSTLYRGINELIISGIIARHDWASFFFINPNFIFNGDRIAFTRLIARKKKVSVTEPDMFDELLK